MKETGQSSIRDICELMKFALFWERKVVYVVTSWWAYDTYTQMRNGALSKALNRGDEGSNCLGVLMFLLLITFLKYILFEKIY